MEKFFSENPVKRSLKDLSFTSFKVKKDLRNRQQQQQQEGGGDGKRKKMIRLLHLVSGIQSLHPFFEDIPRPFCLQLDRKKNQFVMGRDPDFGPLPLELQESGYVPPRLWIDPRAGPFRGHVSLHRDPSSLCDKLQVTHAEILSFFASDKEDGDVEDVGEDEKKGDGGEDEEDEGDFEEDEEDAENEGGFEEDEEDAEDEGEFEEDEEDAEDEGDFKEDEEDGKDEGGLEVDEEDGKDEGGLEVDEEVVDDQIELNIDNGEESEYVPSVSSGDDDLNFDSELEEK
uniref:Uncharacterized protein n=1 Tax=Chromera velia CCMP2878 TaxID=1169474 RepID=A0A0G4HBE1_9ALVE|eukprot:Cvel_25936.t1-p1 / transcript=Cvel_25936.t1 / gene=Cvel_25936 / organism=Chromera_velia_CCMP2878 / gene_product=hypothetical protein / transcript_product=hypothetical protein / location=Cvel_scaffold3003:5069-8245(+) / protein_length=284 / sequence_SO=supercontig / SO=protein_coding / is_pseudo=false